MCRSKKANKAVLKTHLHIPSLVQVNEGIRWLLNFIATQHVCTHGTHTLCLQNMACTAPHRTGNKRAYSCPPQPNETPAKCNIRFLNRQTYISGGARNKYSLFDATRAAKGKGIGQCAFIASPINNR